MTPAEVTVLAEIADGLAEVADELLSVSYHVEEVEAALLAGVVLGEAEAVTAMVVAFGKDDRVTVVGLLVRLACRMAAEGPNRGDLLASLPSQVCDLGGHS
jgi:hypothetical protein